MQKTEQQFLLLTVNQIGNQLIGLPRPARVTLRRDGAGQVTLTEGGCDYDRRFREAVETVWSYMSALLPEQTNGLSLELGVKGRGAIGGGSVGLPLSLVLLGLLLDEEPPQQLYGTGLMGLADGWYTGQLLADIEAKAQALAPMVSPEGSEAALAIPHHRQIELPQPAPRVRYLPVANLARAAKELFGHRADEVNLRFNDLATLDHLPVSDAIKTAFRKNNAQTIVLEATSLEPDGPQEIEITTETWGPAVWVRYPGLPGGGTMVYRFQGERLADKEHFGDAEQARQLGELIGG